MAGMATSWPALWPSPARLCDYCGRVIPAAALSVLVDPRVPFGEVAARICPLCKAEGRHVRIALNPDRAATRATEIASLAAQT